MNQSENHEAILSNDGSYILFSFGNRTIKFRGPYSLDHFCSIKNWDHGYIEVMTKYTHSSEIIEEYIDLIPILENLYMNPDAFLAPIKKVRVEYA